MSLNPYARTFPGKSFGRAFLVFSLLYWSMFFLFAETTVVGDGIHYHLFFPALFSDWNLNLADEFVAYPQGSPFALRFEMEPTGYAANPYPFGSSLLQFPFFLVAWIYDRTLGFASETGMRDFLSSPYLLAQILSTWFYGWLGSLCLWRVLTKVFRIGDAFLIVLSMVTATPLLNYLIHDPAYSHAYSFFAVSFFYFLWFCLSRKDSFGMGLLIGSAGGLVCLVRWQDALFLFPAAVYSVGMILKGTTSEAERRRRKARLWFVGGGMLGFLLWISPQLIYWKILYGDSLLIPLGEKIFNRGETSFRETLFSKRNGLFKWHPITLVGTVGLIWMSYKKRWLGWVIPAMVLQFLFIGSLADWSGSYAFGQRRWVSGLPFFALGLAALFTVRWGPWRWFLRIGILALMVWNFLVYMAWHGNYFEGGRHSASKVFWLVQHSPHRLFRELFQLAFFPNWIAELSFSRIALYSIGFLLIGSMGFVLFHLALRLQSRRAMVGITLLGATLPVGLGASFLMTERMSVAVLHANLSLNAVYPSHPVPLLEVKKGEQEMYTGEVDSILLGPQKKLWFRFQNPQLVSGLNLVAYLSSAAPEIGLGQECLRLTFKGSEGEEIKTFHVGEDLDFPSPEFGTLRQRGGSLNPQTAELVEDGTAYFSYGIEFPFSSSVAREVVIENLLPMGEIGIESVSLIPATLEVLEPTESPRLEPIQAAIPLNLDLLFNNPIPNASPALGLMPGGTLTWRGVPLRISDSTGETCLITGFEPLPIRFLAPINPLVCRAVHFLLGALGEEEEAAGQTLATLCLHFAGGTTVNESIVFGRDVSLRKPLYSDFPKGDYWSLVSDRGGSTGLSVKTVLAPRDSGPLVGVEVQRDPKTDFALVVYSATAVP